MEKKICQKSHVDQFGIEDTLILLCLMHNTFVQNFLFNLLARDMRNSLMAQGAAEPSELAQSTTVAKCLMCHKVHAELDCIAMRLDALEKRVSQATRTTPSGIIAEFVSARIEKDSLSGISSTTVWQAFKNFRMHECSTELMSLQKTTFLDLLDEHLYGYPQADRRMSSSLSRQRVSGYNGFRLKDIKTAAIVND